ncbi:MAG: universal stress protein [Candidatus Abyssobacteria bacterium SURF_5]|uniref:Universal stress protein n=1 Tax=Abyssobacteria bacterium (strain SURF_5) TaxID=2093360 RepID=A0A3A4PDB7_ABYX5|nr:MAG: universal stress protein [Candidatus Abyssubacteria bacterium SURF_5]
MTTVGLDSVGLCAHFSEKGDWAFDFAFALAQKNKCQLNIFYFLRSPYERYSEPPNQGRKLDDQILIATDRKLREYYDKCLGEYVDVGFKVCEESRHAKELRTCLMHREYQLLIIPHLEKGITFGNIPIEEFAYRFTAPVVLVGPDRPNQYHLNPSATLLADKLGLSQDDFHEIYLDEIGKAPAALS